MALIYVLGQVELDNDGKFPLFQFYYGDAYHLLGRGWRCLTRRLMAIIISCCAIKTYHFLDIDLNFSFASGNLRSSLIEKQKLPHVQYFSRQNYF